MKKILSRTTLILIAALLALALSACGSTIPERLVGEWKCDDHASGNKADTSFYSLSIAEDGSFSLDNANTGKPDLAGTMKGDDTGKLGILELTCDDENFNPPEPWYSIHKNSRIRYKILDEGTIKLGYVGIWMTFRK